MEMANIVLDMKGLSCPRPLIGAKRIMDELAAGQVLLLVSDCPGTPDDLFVWAKQTGNHILRSEKMPEGGTGYYVQKGQGHVLNANVTLDIRGAVCPGPIIEAKKLLNGMQTGEVLKLVSDCPGVKTDIGGWASATGMTLLETLESGAGIHEFYIRKG
ncbi:Sulfurtransferase TusA [Ferriphaselus amnicola]|uniref:Sulfurtransferase TusA n=1 Tax=Ferriphaselus amnicola TaxID=1188319 RepID=A0A2Z6GDD9_9PROT|nr:sulfurtransferase TusA family protein [Ferriphaselus amnicola]BBE51450.1 Sulfurtransferase TusA [Ferriphaselus amnicola]